MKPWKLLDSEYLVNAPWLKVAKETCELPNGKVIDDFYTLWQPDWVLILARTTKGKWVMTEQYRHGTGKIALEFPAGIIDKGETPEQAALLKQLDQYHAFCSDLGVTPENAGLAWLLSNPAVTCPIVGANECGQLTSSLKALECKFSPEALAQLDSIFPKVGEAPGAYAW